MRRGQINIGLCNERQTDCKRGLRVERGKVADMHSVRVAVALLVSVLMPFSLRDGVASTSAHPNSASASAGTSSAAYGYAVTASSAMPNNPSQSLPKAINSSIPNSAKVIADNLALLSNGTVKNLTTGQKVTDPSLVGTSSTQPDPLAKTHGKNFIPVSVQTVRSAMVGAARPSSASSANSAVYRAVESSRVRNAALSSNDYGAHWGTYNDTQAFFGGSGDLFAQQAQGVIDVSEFQGTINWSQVKAAGVQGAIIRIGYGWGNDYDAQALRNIAECKRLGIPFGIYLYSYAYDGATADDEGTDVVNKLRAAGVSAGDLSYPIFYDLEAWSWTGHSHPTSPAVYQNIVNAWYGKLQAAGYTNLSVYSYVDYLQNELNSAAIHAKTRWVARYGEEMHFDFSSNYRGWQYWDQGSVSGISGTVDLSAFGNLQYQASVDSTAYAALSIPNGDYYINSFAKDSSSVDMPGASTADGARPQLYQANGSQAQQYRFTRQSNGSYVIINVNSGKALDVSGGAAGNEAVVQQWDPNGSTAQQWYVRDSGAGYYLQSALGNWVLDLAWGSVANGTSARLYAPNGTSTQKFLISAVTTIPINTPVELSSALQSNLAVDLPAASNVSGTRLQLYPWNRTNAQLYTFQQTGNGVYSVLSLTSGKAVEVADASTANGGIIRQWDANGSAAQRWSVLSYGGSSYTLINDASGKAIDTPSANAQSQVLLQSYAVNGTLAQRWTITAQAGTAQLNKLVAEHRSDLSDGTVTLHTALSASMALDVAAGSRSDGALVRLWSANGTTAQRWSVSHDQQGYVILTNVGSGKVLDVASASTANGATIDQFAANGTFAQKWIAVASSSGGMTLHSALAPNLVLDVAGASTALGARVQLFAPNSSTAQRWMAQ